MNNETNTAPAAVDPGTQTRTQRFWLLDNGFQLARDTMDSCWLYTFRVDGRQHCVGIYGGEWAVYRCGPTSTRTLETGATFRAVLAAALRMMAA